MIHTHKDFTLPTHGEILVFGSNMAGRHGKGMALVAKNQYGAIYGQGYGPMGHSFAVPTKDRSLKPLPLSVIKKFADAFLYYAEKNPHKTFFVTRIACGLAGYADSEIAVLFDPQLENCNYAEEWLPYF